MRIWLQRWCTFAWGWKNSTKMVKNKLDLEVSILLDLLIVVPQLLGCLESVDGSFAITVGAIVGFKHVPR